MFAGPSVNLDGCEVFELRLPFPRTLVDLRAHQYPCSVVDANKRYIAEVQLQDQDYLDNDVIMKIVGLIGFGVWVECSACPIAFFQGRYIIGIIR